jgi:hypothetical protein
MPGDTVETLDEEAETYGAEAGQQADNDRDQYHVDLLGLSEAVVQASYQWY